MLGYLIVGAIAGAIASALTSGDKRGCLINTVIGCAGASLVGFVMQNILGAQPGGFVRSIIGATIGAIVILAIVAKMSGKSSKA